MENVAAINSRGLLDVLRDVAGLGYHAEWHSIPAAALGAPHERDRTWIIAHSPSFRQSGARQYLNAIHPTPDAYREASGIVGAFREGRLPYVCRRRDGLSNGMDRLKALGNAVVPQIPEIIGKAIMAHG